ncbi:MAG: PhoH family protein [Bacteroidales bacterium]|nr:PhoH family protein [Bacteroidales bacterium]
MSERTISLAYIDHVSFFGPEDIHLRSIQKAFPGIKIIVRGDTLKAIGSEKDLLNFEKKFSLLMKHFEMFGEIKEKDIEQIIKENSDSQEENKDSYTLLPDLILFGKDGKQIKARTPRQREMLKAIEDNDILFCIGPAGTGKTYTAVAIAIKFLKNKWVKRIILTRPAVEAGENLGFLPGDLRDKLDPYLQPLYDALRDMIPTNKLLSYFEDGTIEIAPLAFMRGRTLENAFVILDEAQNATSQQMKMFLTRMGLNSKFVLTGDITQIDLPKNQVSGLVHVQDVLRTIKGIRFIYFNEEDVVRHPLVNQIIQAYEKHT